MSTVATTVELNNLDIYAFHGASDEEKRIGHRYWVSVHADVQETASVTDEVADTLDYSSLAALVQTTMGGPSKNTVEFLARAIASAVFEAYDRVEQVSVTVLKPNPPMNAIAESAGATVFLRRGE